MHLNHGHFLGDWSAAISTRAPMPTDFASNYQLSQLSDATESSPSAALDHQASFDQAASHSLPVYQQTVHPSLDLLGHHASSNLPALHGWSPSRQVAHGFTQQACFTSALSAPPPALGLQAGCLLPVSNNIHSCLDGIDGGYESSSMVGLHDYDPHARAGYQHPQIVVPSQLSPQDGCADHAFGEYLSPEHGMHDIQSSFASSSTSFGDYEDIDPPSPLEGYFDNSGEEGYLMVKEEVPSSPALAASMIRKRRSTKRNRGTRSRHCWYQEVNFDGASQIEVRCEGRPFPLPTICPGPDDKLYTVERARSSKQHMCDFVLDNGKVCGARFDRSEHLKRHGGSHEKKEKRRFPCPLPKCKAERIGRPDNAGDHFKTHMRLEKTGKRNGYFEWEVIQNAIWTHYEDQKAAKKLLANLQRWIDNGKPETGGNRRTKPQKQR